MPTFYNYTENGIVKSFDDHFVPGDAFRQGGLWTWGANTTRGGLGDNTTTTKCTPVTTFAGGISWRDVSANGQSEPYCAAIRTDGTLWTWGSNSNGKLGDNTTTNRFTPVQTFAGGTNWKQVSCSGYAIAAIKTDGTLWTWGQNYSATLGVNDSAVRCTPVTTFAGGTNWKQVAAGSSSILAIKTDGTLWAWGANAYGQLATGDKITRSTPVQTITGATNWKQVACNDTTSAAIKTDGTLWVWGRNNTVQLGTNDIIDRCTPVQTFAGGTDWKQVSVGGQSQTGTALMSAIKTDGTLWAWGFNGVGQLGVGDVNNRSTPVTTFAGGNNWKQVSVGRRYFTTAVKSDGTLWTWGIPEAGQLGINTASFSVVRCTPVTTFAGGTNWKQVSAGWSHAAAITFVDSYI